MVKDLLAVQLHFLHTHQDIRGDQIPLELCHDELLRATRFATEPYEDAKLGYIFRVGCIVANEWIVGMLAS